MFVVILFVLTATFIGANREEDDRKTHLIILGLSCVFASLLYSLRFA